jgi:tRNA-specific 2-thiouridylase
MARVRKTVFVGLSGGVDSSVAALLLQRQGYDVVGVFMRCVNLDGCAERDAEDARRVAGNLSIPFYVWDFEKEYRSRVVDYMIDGYRNGITPNPDVMCNREIKFGLFRTKALAMGADFVATGHYVQKAIYKGKAVLKQAVDTTKDQSYFLWTLTSHEIATALFPIGEYKKTEVRKMAAKADLPTAAKKDSQGICFLGDISLHDFLKEHIPTRQGAVVTTEGKKIGEHDGAWFYTIGQRHGLNLAHKNAALGLRDRSITEPYYVAAKEAATNTLVVAEHGTHEALYKKEIPLVSVHFVSRNAPVGAVWARIRYRQPLGKAVIHMVTKSSGALAFEKPQKFVAPGQSAVLYTEEGVVLGGGVVASEEQ